MDHHLESSDAQTRENHYRLQYEPRTNVSILDVPIRPLRTETDDGLVPLPLGSSA